MGKTDCPVSDWWELRRGTEVLCAGTIPWLGYSRETLVDMIRNGLVLYRNGKRVKTKELGGTP